MFKTNNETILIDAKATDPIPTGVVFWSHDRGTAKLIFQLQKDYMNQPLSAGTIVPILLEFNSDTAEGGRGRHIYNATIEDSLESIVSIVLEDNILGYQGRVDGSVYIELPDSRSLDTAGRFTFDIKRSPIDENVPELEDYYWQGFNEIIDEYHQTIITIKSEAKALIDSLTADVTEVKNEIGIANSRVDEISKKIDDNDVLTKAESSVNVINQIGGAESTILKKELLVNGTEGMASRFVKDLPYMNIILNGDFKNGITNWSYHQPAGNLSEFVDDVVHAKSNNGTVTGVFQPSNQRLKYGYSTKANEKFFFYALAKGTGTIQLGFDKKRGSATLTQNYTWVGVESTGTTDNEVMTFYTTGEMWIKAIVVSKTEIMNIESFYPAAEDVGVVHGQPNLQNGTSSTLSEVTFIQTQYKETNLVVSNLFKPNDLVTYAVQIDNTAGTADVFAQLAFKKSDNTYVSFNGSSVLKGSIGRSMVQVTVLEEYTNIYVKPLVKSNSTISTTVRYGEEKLIKGSLEAMDEWTPSQADSGLTPINGGMVPFNEKDYEDLLSDDGIVRAETKIVGSGAEIEFKFDVIGTLEKKYPYLFEGLSSMAEKIGAVNKILKSMSLVSTFRGGGLNSSSGASLNFARWNILRNKANSTTALDYSTVNLTADFKNYEISLNNMLALNIRDEGNTVLYLASKKNGNSDNGAISDGVTPAWIEVKDIRLTVELEVNGRTIIEELIAANHIENLATEEEAETGEDNKKIMTPLRVMQSIKKFVENKFVSIAGNETIGGLKNFRDGLMVKENTVLTHKGVVTIKYSNADFPTEIASGYITFVRYGDEIQVVFNFKTRTDKDFAKDQSIIWGIAADFQADTSEPQYIGIASTGGTTSLVKFTANGATLTAHSTLTKDTWYAGTVTYLAKNKL
ncbi:hypothetical protein ABE940_11325 [Enterococcus avium]|uniref:hypothetical protein n=1 Tax=Enterococcus avium TaxID=33945 RepID=UPI003D6B6291